MHGTRTDPAGAMLRLLLIAGLLVRPQVAQRMTVCEPSAMAMAGAPTASVDGGHALAHRALSTEPGGEGQAPADQRSGSHRCCDLCPGNCVSVTPAPQRTGVAPFASRMLRIEVIDPAAALLRPGSRYLQPPALAPPSPV